MKQSKFTINSLLIIITIFTAITLFVTIKLTGYSDRSAVNTYYKIPGTDFAVKHSSVEADGIYKGGENNAELLMEGTFGIEWGAAIKGNILYTNEYSKSELGLIVSDVVKIDLKENTKEILYKKAVLRGEIKSGELAIIKNYFMPSNYSASNSLCKLYNSADFSSDATIKPELVFYDCSAGKEAYSTDTIIEKKFDEMYIEKSLEEIRK